MGVRTTAASAAAARLAHRRRLGAGGGRPGRGRAPGRAPRARGLPGPDRRAPRRLDRAGDPQVPAPPPARGRRRRRAAHAPGARPLRPAPARQQAAAERHPGLGRRGAPVPARPARLPVGIVRRRLRRPHCPRRPAVPALRGARARRPRRPRHARGAAPGAARDPDPALLAAARDRRRRFGPRGDTSTRASTSPPRPARPSAAAASGRVSFAGRDDGYGLLVVVAHAGGVRTLYAHLSGTRVHVRERVSGRRANRKRGGDGGCDRAAPPLRGSGSRRRSRPHPGPAVKPR